MMRSQMSSGSGKASDALAQSIDELPEDCDDDEDDDDDQYDDADEGATVTASAERQQQRSGDATGEPAQETGAARESMRTDSRSSSERMSPDRLLAALTSNGGEASGDPSAALDSDKDKDEDDDKDEAGRDCDEQRVELSGTTDEDREESEQENDKREGDSEARTSIAGGKSFEFSADSSLASKIRQAAARNNRKEYRGSLQLNYEPKHYVANCAPITFIPLTANSRNSNNNDNNSANSDSDNNNNGPQAITCCPHRQRRADARAESHSKANNDQRPTSRAEQPNRPPAAIMHQCSMPQLMASAKTTGQQQSTSCTGTTRPQVSFGELPVSADSNKTTMTSSTSSLCSSTSSICGTNPIVLAGHPHRHKIPKHSTIVGAPNASTTNSGNECVSCSGDNWRQPKGFGAGPKQHLATAGAAPAPASSEQGYCGNSTGKPMRSRSERLHLRRYSTSITGQQRQLISIIGANHPALMNDPALITSNNNNSLPTNYYMSSSSSSSNSNQTKTNRRLSVLPSGVQFTESGSVLPLANPSQAELAEQSKGQFQQQQQQQQDTAQIKCEACQNNQQQQQQLTDQQLNSHHQVCRRAVPTRTRRYSSVYIADGKIRRHTLASTATCW